MDGFGDEEMSVSKRRKKKPAIKISDAGGMGRDILNDIVNGVTGLTPIGGRIYVEINLEIEDEHLLKDDQSRSAKLIVEVEMGKKEEA